MVYAREVDGEKLTFAASRNLIFNSLVMYDRETETLWSQFLGEAVRGPLVGAKLKLVSSQVAVASAWIERHPDTLVLGGIIGETNVDDELNAKELVLGIVGERGQKAYSYRNLSWTPVVNDNFEGRDLVATLVERDCAAGLFDREIEGRKLTFGQADDPNSMTDRETGSTWDKQTGEALSGPFNGRRLQKVRFISSSRSAWFDFYPETKLMPRRGLSANRWPRPSGRQCSS